jgi:hypothetical protein
MFTTVEKITRLFDSVSVSVNKDGYILIPSGGQTKQFIEVEPGLLRNREDAADQYVFKVDTSGQVYLLTSGPNALIRTPWYGTSGFQALIFGGGLLLFIITLLKANGLPSKRL